MPLILRIVIFSAFLCRVEAELTPFAEPGFPFLTSTVDAHAWGKLGYPAENLTPRGLILRMPGNGCACFDIDLLRVAATWQAGNTRDFLTWTGTAPISWVAAKRKSEGGQDHLPEPVGQPLTATGQLPGWVAGTALEEITLADFTDSRPLSPSPDEPGRGPLPGSRWQGLRMESGGGVALHYQIQDTTIVERQRAAGWRSFTIGPATQPLVCLLDERRSPPPAFEAAGGTIRILQAGGRFLTLLGIAPHRETVNVSISLKGQAAPAPAMALPDWKRPVITQGIPGNVESAYVVDTIPLPSSNPWGRLVRSSGMAFFPDGRAVICTIDGDVWIASGLDDGLKSVAWRRFASGLHEPQSIQVRGTDVFTFTRDGLLQLIPGPDETCVEYRNHCNAFSQTAETREFAMDMVVKPDGGFFLCKGGQQLSRHGLQAGRVLEISADGNSVSEFCSGLRQGYLGMNPRTGLLTASDQQGHWIPTTPLHVLERGKFYGYPDGTSIPPPAEAAAATCLIPHSVNQSAAGQVWLENANMGSLNGALIHLSYFRPGLFQIFLDPAGHDAAAVPLDVPVDIPLLKGAVHPLDGSLYVTGFQIWGTDARERSGLVRIRPGKQPGLQPTRIESGTDGIFLEFSVPPDPASITTAAFTTARWAYQRSKNYGSSHYTLSGAVGQEALSLTGLQRTADGRGILLQIADMKAAPQLQLTWQLRTNAGSPMNGTACLTIHRIVPRDYASSGLGLMEAPVASAALAKTVASAGEGRTLSQLLGCTACHSTDGKMEGMKGPSWKHLAGSERTLVGGQKVIANSAYLRESILNPAARVSIGFNHPDTGMPPYAGILNETQLQSIVLFLESLAPEE